MDSLVVALGSSRGLRSDSQLSQRATLPVKKPHFYLWFNFKAEAHLFSSFLRTQNDGQQAS